MQPPFPFQYAACHSQRPPRVIWLFFISLTLRRGHIRLRGWSLTYGCHFNVLESVCAAVFQVCDREGRARHAREALRSPGLSRHGGALDAPARLLPEAEADQQPPGPVRTRRCLGLSSILSNPVSVCLSASECSFFRVVVVQRRRSREECYCATSSHSHKNYYYLETILKLHYYFYNYIF